jgi:hypothetical protein
VFRRGKGVLGVRSESNSEKWIVRSEW